ncbi:hypothetical protein CJI59_10705 [Streptomyces sp. Alain-F2R5]|nr:hypothetical protein [Streptomyces sp. Alain-F2R5]OSC65876.1 hypothetical protein B5181_18095 [Streptomyces sp. 4F]PAN01591.1 hypothetical protein CJI59_10705 [Streptomyces sp. Alain-F2R5]
MSESGPVPGGRPGEVERTPAPSGERSGRDPHGVVPPCATGAPGPSAAAPRRVPVRRTVRAMARPLGLRMRTAGPAGAARPACRRLPDGPRDEVPDDG